MTLCDVLTKYETGYDHWYVVPWEAGTGKSLQTDHAIAKYLTNRGNKHFLIVKRFDQEVRATVERINSCGHSDLALGITADNWPQYKSPSYPLELHSVLVITLARYMRLCRDAETWKRFAYMRDVLVVDEALHPEIIQFHEAYYKQVLGTVSHVIDEAVTATRHGMFAIIDRKDDDNDQLKYRVGNRLPVVVPRGDSATDLSIDVLKRYVDANISNIEPEIMDRLQEYIRTVDSLYGYKCIYSFGKIFGYDRHFRFATLQHNLILDANGSFSAYYKLSPNFTIGQSPTVVDHSKWTFHQIQHNSTATKIGRTPKYWDEICKTMLEYHRDKKMLVVCHLSEEQTLQAKLDEYAINADVAHFGNIIGKNDWREHNQVWIVGTPNLSFSLYPIYHAIATGEELPDEDIQLIALSGKLMFAEYKYNSILHSYILGEIYQAIKRINRDNTLQAEVFVVTMDSQLIKDIAGLMKGMVISDKVITLNTQETKQDTKRTKADELVNWLLLNRGEHAKKHICSTLIINSGNLGRLLKHDRLQRLIQSGKIKLYQNSIIVL